MPEDIEYYVHRIGRTGRAGKTGRSFTLVVGREVYKIRDIERVCHTKIKERKIPNAADIMARKAEKILKEAALVIEQQDISRAMEYLLDEVALGQYSAMQIAAAFMQMKLGDEIEDIKTEKFIPDRKGNGRGWNKGGRTRDSQQRGRGSRESAGRQKGRGGIEWQNGKSSRGDKFRYDGKDKKGSAGRESGKARERNGSAGREWKTGASSVPERVRSQYGPLRIRTKK